MRLDNFDLNLLVAFDVLLQERNVTRAANRLNVTQAAMSAALKRLRESFEDDILKQHGKKMIPTARAIALAPEISRTIMQLRSLISSGKGFDPQTSDRRFKIAASDYITTVLIVPLLDVLQREAPHLRLDISLPNHDTVDQLINGELDLFLTPEDFVHPDHPRDLLFEERYVVVGWSGNPIMQMPLTTESFFGCGHIAVQIGHRNTFIERALEIHGLERRVEITAPSFIQAPWLIPGTMRLSLMHERLAQKVAPAASLVIAEPPISLPVMQEMMQFHASRETDEALIWLRRKLKQVSERPMGLPKA
ncbi:LysR family transcriptional regulator [Sphingorhabdus sp. YGSMI21]|uniref:LysR family transcriptional regulator n=1 Tax=Sphingorhabdus sp. YGSMI21 TaxID=2077182 RepID=UPI000C1E2465|nr:LysR family transcriptional regulator [Sphingorhabdus sp. YGSMI21]ATW04728.1 LysR family transcriptional regulator [Sphingorhabdus sp. YGSMI21]